MLGEPLGNAKKPLSLSNKLPTLQNPDLVKRLGLVFNTLCEIASRAETLSLHHKVRQQGREVIFYH